MVLSKQNNLNNWAEFLGGVSQWLSVFILRPAYKRKVYFNEHQNKHESLTKQKEPKQTEW